METIPPNSSVEKLRQIISTVHFLKQAKGFNLVTQEDYDSYIKKLNDKTHTIMDEIVKTIDGETAA